MAEYVRVGYRRLFDVRVLHHYWLDQGATPFDSIADEDARTERLLRYDVRQFLSIVPSASTERMIAGLRGIFRMTGSGFIVAVPDDSVVTADVPFEFSVSPAAADFGNYTALTLRPQPVVEVAEPDGTVHRYKANVPVLSNLTGATRGTGPDKRLFLSREFGFGAGEGVESFVVAGTELRQLTGDPPAALFQVLGPKDELPVFVHQGDAPALDGLPGAPARGVEMSGETPFDVCAVVRLHPRRADDGDFSVVDGDGRPRTPPRVFEIHLKNRSTTWRYRNKRDGSAGPVEPGPLPLTFFGNAGTRPKPSTNAIDIEPDNGAPPRITRLISDIYV